jgi:RNA ligase
MVLLAVVDNATGQDLPLPCLGEWSGSRVDRFDFDSLEAIALAERDDAEGYVIRFRSGMRVKIKGAEYVRLHRILTGVSARTIWECLSKGDSLDKMLDRVPDEFYQWVHKVACGLAAAYRLVEDSAAKDLEALHSLRDDRKAFASEAIKSKYRGILFAMLDGKDYSRIIWKDLKPAADRPFVEDEA